MDDAELMHVYDCGQDAFHYVGGVAFRELLGVANAVE